MASANVGCGGARPKCPRRSQPPFKNENRRRVMPVVRETQDQDDEMLALASIFDSDVFHVNEGQYTGYLSANVRLQQPVSVSIGLKELTERENDRGLREECQLDFLPPITLNFKLPPDYPSTRKPYFNLTCSWLNKVQLSKVYERLDKIWDENAGEVVLFRWMEFLTEECAAFMGIEKRLDLSWVEKALQQDRTPQKRTIGKNGASEAESNGNLKEQRSTKAANPSSRVDTDVRSSRSKSEEMVTLKRGDRTSSQDSANLAMLLPTLLEYNRKCHEDQFNATVFSCNVCFEDKPGSQCIRFSGCDHIYCRDCMRSYFEVQIKEGNVKCLNCPGDRCSSQATPSQIRDLVGEALFAKYDQLLLSSTLETMTDIAYCPRVACQCPALKEPGTLISRCPGCFFVFCIQCKMAYHGVQPCRLREEERRLLYQRYTEGDDQVKQELEIKHGKATIQHLIETILSEGWVGEHSKDCPKCGAHIEKIDGCNKMACWKCECYFCWLCLDVLDRSNPYKHFEHKGNACFNRLFAGAFEYEEEEPEPEEGGFVEVEQEEEAVNFADYL